jgi:hypothetical protein
MQLGRRAFDPLVTLRPADKGRLAASDRRGRQPVHKRERAGGAGKGQETAGLKTAKIALEDFQEPDEWQK